MRRCLVMVGVSSVLLAGTYSSGMGLMLAAGLSWAATLGWVRGRLRY